MADQPPRRPGLIWFVVALIVLLLAVLGIMWFGYDHSSLTDTQENMSAGARL